MKERPILFSAPMVRALLDGSKTQTRRAAKLPHMNPLGEWEPTTFGGEHGGRTREGKTLPEQGAIWHTRTGDCICSPYGPPGDKLWVRETHRPIFGQTCGLIAVDYRADPREKWERLGDAPDSLVKPTKWVPSIHMRREYSRITLEIVSVRVEMLNDISEGDVVKEGCPSEILYGRGWYRQLWESINGAGSWDANPFCWVIEFKRVAA